MIQTGKDGLGPFVEFLDHTRTVVRAHSIDEIPPFVVNTQPLVVLVAAAVGVPQEIPCTPTKSAS